MFKKLAKNEKGFTLVELLAVIVILGIIAAIAIPSIGSIIEKSKEDAVKADAIQVLNAAKTYVAANGVPAGSTIKDTDLTKYVNNVSLDSGYTVTTDGTTFSLTGTGKGSSSVTITFDQATITGINNDKNYDQKRTINATGSTVSQ